MNVGAFTRGPRQPPRLHTYRYIGAMIGAALVVLAAFGPSLISSRAKPAASRLYQTAAGERATIHLADGSRVTLAPASRLEIAAGFDAKQRLVSLSGQAYFDVSATDKSPFVVQTGSITTRVLGTRFDVRHYATEPFVRVAVANGKVVTGSQSNHVTLSQGMIAQVTDSTATTITSSDIGEIGGWVEGRLAFKNTPVSVVLATVGRWYGCQIRLADSTAANEIVTTTLDIDARDKTLGALEMLLDVTRSVRDTTITLYPRKRSINGHPLKDVRSIPTQTREVGR